MTIETLEKKLNELRILYKDHPEARKIIVVQAKLLLKARIELLKKKNCEDLETSEALALLDPPQP